MVALALCSTGCGAEPAPPGALPAGRVAGTRAFPAPDFALSDQHGRTFRLSEQRGRPVLLFFGYAYCPDVCPAVLSTWAAVQSQLGDRSEEVTFAFVTVDPERDTPERLAAHLAVFGSSLRGLGGTPEELEPVYAAYGIAHEKTAIAPGSEGYVVDHTSHMFLVDQEGAIVRTFGFQARAQDITRRLQRLLRRGEEAQE
jgi:protein SCO1